jgi:hypothetical protein
MTTDAELERFARGILDAEAVSGYALARRIPTS